MDHLMFRRGRRGARQCGFMYHETNMFSKTDLVCVQKFLSGADRSSAVELRCPSTFELLQFFSEGTYDTSILGLHCSETSANEALAGGSWRGGLQESTMKDQISLQISNKP